MWDYTGDNYVHRLVANKVDGKLVELPEGDHKGQRKGEEVCRDFVRARTLCGGCGCGISCGGVCVYTQHSPQSRLLCTNSPSQDICVHTHSQDIA